MAFKTSHRQLLEHYLIPLLESWGAWGDVLDVGSKDARYKKHMRFQSYTTLDCEPAYKPDICCKIEDLDSTNQFDTVLCSQTLEHVENPQLAVDSMYRALRKGGIAIVSVPWIFPTHAKADYHRFNDQSLNLLFKDFSQVKITPYGNLVSSAWMVFNFPNYLGIFNWLFAFIGRWTIPSCADGFIIEAIK